jgi:hypothetical protein
MRGLTFTVIYLSFSTYKDIQAHIDCLLASTLLSVLCQHISMKFMTTLLKQNHTNNKKMRLRKSRFTDQKVRYLLEIWRQDAAGASLKQANAGEKEERQRERPRKNKGFNIF